MKRQIANTLNTFNTSDDAVIPLEDSSVEPVQPSQEVTQLRHKAIEEAAYWRASERGFTSGGELDDWLGAEADVDGVRTDKILEL
jgi:hypothetical protein